MELTKTAKDNLSDEENKALEELAKDKSIIITKADKGNAVVIQDLETYREKVQVLLESNGKFVKLKEDPTIEREKSLANFLYKMHTNGAFDDSTYKKIYPCGSKAGVLYGLPKIHKNETPIRPIISAIGTYTHKLAKYLVEILTSCFSDIQHMISDTFDFVNRASTLVLEVNDHILSYDI